MYLVALAWMYVVLMMAVAEAMAPNGTVLGAVFTFVLYGVLPLSILLYLLGTPARRRARQRAEATSTQPDGSGEPPRDPIAPERKKP
jgi:membrane protein implicated in regulation of membrane protease activity